MNVHKVKEILLLISERLGRLPSALIFLCYIICIFIFAGIFTTIKDQFYQNTVYQERMYEVEIAELSQTLKNGLFTYLWAEHDTFKPTSNGWEIDWILSDITNFDIHDSKVSFDLSLDLKEIETPWRRTRTRIGINFSILSNRSITYSENKKGKAIIMELSIPDNCPINPSDIFPKNVSGVTGPGILIISNEVEQRLREFQRTTKGQPHATGGTYWRMFYLSAVTITTLGFGDIVPLTPLARFLIAFVAIWGVVLMGLFLNSLMHEP